MNRRKFMKAVGIGTATTALVGGNAAGQAEPVSGGGSGGGTRTAPFKMDSDVGVSVSPHFGTDDADANGFTAHVDPNDDTRLILSGSTLLQSDERELEVYDTDIDEDEGVIDLTLQFFKTDDAETDAAPGVGVRGGGGGGMSDGGGSDTRYHYKVHGFVEFDRSVSDYEFDV